MTLLRLAWLNLVRHRAATLLAVISLGLTVACAGMLLRTARLAEARFGTIAVAGDALIAAKGDATEAVLGALNAEGAYPRFLPMRLFGTLVNEAWYAAGKTAHATSVVPLVYAGLYEPTATLDARASRSARANYRVAGTIKAFFDMPSPTPRLAFARGEWTDLGAGAVVGAAVARREGLSIGDTMRIAHWTSDDMPTPAQSGLRPRAFLVSGILEPSGTAWDRLVFINLVQAERLMSEGLRVAGRKTAWESYVLHYILVHAAPGGLDSLEALIDQKTVSQIVPVRGTLESLERLTAAGRRAAAVMASLALLLAVTTLSALMLGRFEGLARQAAVLEAMGWSKSELRRLLVWEGALLGFAAAGFGAVLDAALFPFLRGVFGGALPDAAVIPSSVWISLPVWVTAIVVTVSASLASSLLLFRGRAQERVRGLG